MHDLSIASFHLCWVDMKRVVRLHLDTLHADAYPDKISLLFMTYGTVCMGMLRFLNLGFLIVHRPFRYSRRASTPWTVFQVSKGYSLLMDNPSLDYAENMSTEDKNILRAFIIELVLGTDMKKHFGLVSHFQVRCNPDLQSSRGSARIPL